MIVMVVIVVVVVEVKAKVALLLAAVVALVAVAAVVSTSSGSCNIMEYTDQAPHEPSLVPYGTSTCSLQHELVTVLPICST